VHSRLVCYQSSTYSALEVLHIMRYDLLRLLNTEQWRSQRGVWGVQTPSIEKGVHILLLCN